MTQTTESTMRLSDAMMLGSTTMQARAIGCGIKRGGDAMVAGYGCALDMAVVAVQGHGTWHEASRIWPWIAFNGDVLSERYYFNIACKFDKEVMLERSMTLDAFVDHVRSIEPVPQSETVGRLAEVESALELPQSPVLPLDHSRHSRLESISPRG